MRRDPLTDKEAPSDDRANQEIGQENSAEKRKWTWKEFYERGFRHAGVTLWEWDSKTGVLLIDALALGHPFYYEFSSPTSWEKLVHKEDRDRLLDALRRFEETPGSSLDCFFRLATKFTRWVHARDMHLVLDSEQKLSKVIGLFFDVTESELAKNQLFWGKQPPARDDGDGVRVLRMISERLRHEKDASRIAALRNQCYHQFMSVFSFSDIPSFRKDSDLFTIEVNPAMERLLGMSREGRISQRNQGLISR